MTKAEAYSQWLEGLTNAEFVAEGWRGARTGCDGASTAVRGIVGARHLSSRAAAAAVALLAGTGATGAGHAGGGAVVHVRPLPFTRSGARMNERPYQRLAQLQVKYPTAYPCGFECGAGWFDILDRLGAVLQQHGVSAVQVKERFGGLRVYVHAAHGAVHKAIDAAEAEADSTCEVCGQPGLLVSLGGWLKTLCEACAAGKTKP